MVLIIRLYHSIILRFFKRKFAASNSLICYTCSQSIRHFQLAEYVFTKCPLMIMYRAQRTARRICGSGCRHHSLKISSSRHFPAKIAKKPDIPLCARLSLIAYENRFMPPLLIRMKGRFPRRCRCCPNRNNSPDPCMYLPGLFKVCLLYTSRCV